MDRQADKRPFDDVYGRMREELAAQVGEKSGAYHEANQNLREEIVRCIWFGSHFPPDALQTDDGRQVEVLSPGWWNVEGGPDFIRAEFLLEGLGRGVGDVEVHTLASSWRAHGHNRQSEYEDVALHVVMWNDISEDAVKTSSGRRVPQLTLSRFIEEDLEELVELVDLEGGKSGAAPGVPGRYCEQALRDGEIQPQWIGRLLDIAGDHRVVQKADSVAQKMDEDGRERLLYQHVAEALGYKNNRMPFIQLTSLLPLRRLREVIPADANMEEKSLTLEASFFGVGGLLEPPAESDPETERYVRRLVDTWNGMPQPVRAKTMQKSKWQFGGARPVNYPSRRIAALAGLYAAHLEQGLFSHFVRTAHAVRPQDRQTLGTALRKAFLDAFCSLEHSYWSYRYALGGKKLQRPRKLVGEERAMSLIVDVLLPSLLAHAGNEGDSLLAERLELLWRELPRRQPNAVTRRMRQTIFGAADKGGEVVNSARRQQGLHQLYKDFCNTEAGCERCVVRLAKAAGRDLIPV